MEFEPTEGKDFLDSYFFDKDDIILTFGFHELFEITYNWFLHLKKINLDKNCLLICLEEESYKIYKKLNLPCILYKTNVNFKNFILDETKSVIFNIVSYIYNTYKKNILYTSTDVIFLKNPFEKLKSEILDYHIGLTRNKICKALSLINNDDAEFEDIWYKETHMFVYLKYNENVKHLLVKILSDFYYDNFDNTQLIGIDRYATKYNNFLLKTIYLPIYYFSNLYYVLNYEFLKEKILDLCYTITYQISWNVDYLPGYGDVVDENGKMLNSYEDIPKFKKILMQKNNHWLV